MSVIGQEKGIAHGTLKGYKQHRYRKVPSCEACLQAVREDNARRTAARTTPRKRKRPAEPRRQAVATLEAPERESSPFGVIHGDTAREPALTYIPYERDERAREAARRERVKAAVTCLLLADQPGELIETLGIPDEEAALARQVVDRIESAKEPARD